jgi:RNA polymerase sigma-70 factor (ECF subfamily)
MAPDASFATLLRRVRAGDARAAEDLIRQFEPEIRRAVRLRLTDPRYCRLHRVLDSADICQSVLGSFFVRAALGQYDLAGPEDLVRLLTTMARNKLIDQARRPGNRPCAADGAETLGQVIDPGDSPSAVVAGRDLLEEFLRHMSAEERRLAELRAAGLGWAEVAARVGSTAEAVRKQLGRAIERVERRLGRDGGSHA